LYSLLCARVGATILFDDYFDRPHYFIVEKFCKLNSRSGRMGKFIVVHNFNHEEITAKIAQYSIDWA
jgi:hypothetical protein